MAPIHGNMNTTCPPGVGQHPLQVCSPSPRKNNSSCFRTIPLAAAFLCLPLAGTTMAGNFIKNVNTDKARYNRLAPFNETPTIWVDIENRLGFNFSGPVRITCRSLDAVLYTASQTVTISNNASTSISFAWSNIPATDYKGYLVEVTATSVNTEVDRYNTAIDCSSNWVKFPRYGFLSKLLSGDNVGGLVWEMKNFHINSIQFYDWGWQHHRPAPPSNWTWWEDVAKRPIQRQKVNDGIQAAHNYGMLAMAYGLMNGSYNNYWTDGSGLQLAWGQYTNQSLPFDLTDQDQNPMPGGWATDKLYLFNPASDDWQNYICGQFNQVYAQFGFDGWHIDTLGWRGPTLHTWEGYPFAPVDTLAGFVNAARTRTGKRVVLNPVGMWGIDTVAQNATQQDVFYNELWDDAESDDYQDLLTLCDRIRSRTSKAIVFAAYMNRKTAKAQVWPNRSYFNEPSVRLANAVMFANGASHIEIGDGAEMLSDEYFAYQSLYMHPTCYAAMRSYYTFLTAYENLLRDGTVTDTKQIWLGNPQTPANYTLSSSYSAEPYKVWKISKLCGSTDVVHLINLDNNGSTKWRADDANYVAPDRFTNIPMKIYYSGAVGSAPKVWMASPDLNFGSPRVLTTTKGSDGAGNFVSFTVPELQYWDMFWIKR